MPPERARQLDQEAVDSLRRQREIEAADDLSFVVYLRIMYAIRSYYGFFDYVQVDYWKERSLFCPAV